MSATELIDKGVIAYIHKRLNKLSVKHLNR